MGNPAAPPEWEETKTAASSLGLQAELLDVRSPDDLGRAFDLAVRQHVGALVVGFDGLTQMHRPTIVDWVARRRLPAVYPAREFVEAGGLMFPWEQPTKFELVINRTTARALGLAIPQSLLLRADVVIQSGTPVHREGLCDWRMVLRGDRTAW